MTDFLIELATVGLGKNGARYSATLINSDGPDELIVKSASVPICAAARVLEARGANPNGRLRARWKGSNILAFDGRIGWLAAHTVKENQGKTVFMKYAPNPWGGKAEE